MSLSEFPDGRIKVRWRDITGAHRAKTFSPGLEPDRRRRRQMAEDFERQKKHETYLGVPSPADPRKRLSSVVEEFVPVFVAQKAPKTQRLYRGLWNGHLKPAFGNHPVNRLTASHIEAWLAESDAGLPTKRKALILLGQIMKFAEKRHYTLHNPVPLVDRLKVPVSEPVAPPTPLEVERMRKAFLDDERYLDATLLSLLAYAGLRPGEALGLRRRDVRKKTILVHATKTNTWRSVGMLAPVAEDVRWWMAQQLAFETTPLFPDHLGRHWSDTTYSNWRKRVWEGTEKKPGPAYGTGQSPKNLRHTFVSLLMRDESYTRREIADQAGHSLAMQDRTYSHVWAELRGAGSAEDAIREARAEVFGPGVGETTGWVAEG